MFYIGLYSEKHEKIFLFETIWPRVLIFSMYHHLVYLFQVCSNYAPGAENGPTPGSHVLHRLIYGKKRKKIFCDSGIYRRFTWFNLASSWCHILDENSDRGNY